MRKLTTHHRRLKTWQRNVSLLLVAVWLSVLIQPCVMAATAASPDAGLQATGHVHAVEHVKVSCAHCSITAGGCDSGDPGSRFDCMEGESSTDIISVASFEQKIKVEKLGPLALSLALNADTPPAGAGHILTIPPGLYFSSPSIIDLFRTYLI